MTASPNLNQILLPPNLPAPKIRRSSTTRLTPLTPLPHTSSLPLHITRRLLLVPDTSRNNLDITFDTPALVAAAAEMQIAVVAAPKAQSLDEFLGLGGFARVEEFFGVVAAGVFGHVFADHEFVAVAFVGVEVEVDVCGYYAMSQVQDG